MNVSSQMGAMTWHTSGGHYAYTTSKAALNMVTRALAGDLIRDDITTITVHPGWVQTDMPDGEIYKNLDTVRQLYKDFAEAGLDRNGVVIALGGGVVGDTVGFAAASYMRGVRLVQIPTSLLSMVDSSVGGKVGVDIPEGKNLVGAFKQPELVIIDTDVLKSLPPVEVRCGLAEAMSLKIQNRRLVYGSPKQTRHLSL